MVPIVSAEVAVGAATRGMCGQPTAVGATPATAMATLASVARVQASASNESKTCRIRWSGAGQAWLAQRVGVSLPRFNHYPLASSPCFKNSC